MSTVIVRLKKQGSEPETLRFDKYEIYIGRLEQNDITLSMTNVSKKHAVVWVDNGVVYVSDAGSTNGTYVNKRRINQPTAISPTDEVYVGDFVFTVQLEQSQPYDAPPSYDPEPGYSMGSASGSVGGHTGSGPAAMPPSGGLGRSNTMPPPIRGGGANRPPEDYLAGPAISNTQQGPQVPRSGTQRSAPAVQDDLSDIYLEDSDPQQRMSGGHEYGMRGTPDHYNTDARRHDSLESPVVPTPPSDLHNNHNNYPPQSSHNDYNGTNFERPDFSTRSESDGAIPNPNANTRFGSPQMNEPAPPPSIAAPPSPSPIPEPSPLTATAHRARHPLSSPKLASPRSSSSLDGDSKSTHRLAGGPGPALASTRIRKPGESPTSSSAADIFSFPPNLVEKKDTSKQEEREELFESFIESLEADGINPLQVSPLSEDLLIPYLTRIDADEELQQAFSDEILQMGPITSLLKDKSVTEIYVNRYDQIVVRRGSKVSFAPITFHSRDSLLLTAKRLAYIDTQEEVHSGTFVDIRFQDNAIATVMIPPEGTDAQPLIVIQRKQVGNESLDNLIKSGMLSDAMATFLTRALASGQNIIIAGPIASQRLRLLSALTAKVPSSVRLLYISRGHQIQLPSTSITLRESEQKQSDIQQLLSTGVALRPDRIILEQLTGVEAYSWVTTISTAIEGCITTIGASSTQDVLGNLLTLSMLANHVPSPYAIKEQIARTIDLVVVINNIGGTPRIATISEVDGVDIGSFRINDIFRFRIDDAHSGHFDATGYIPQEYENLRQSGIDVDISIFRD